MSGAASFVVAILYPGSREVRSRAELDTGRFGALSDALHAIGIRAEPAVYDDDFADEVESQLSRANVVLVWHNPIEHGRTRTVLDGMLRRVAAQGVFVSAHPDTILRMGTKDVLVEVRDLPFGSDSYRIETMSQLQAELPQRLANGPRVLKQHRGHSGIGVWRIERLAAERFAFRHAQRGSLSEEGPFRRVLECLAPYFADGGHMIDQAWQPRLQDGMVRAYLVGDRVAGFGHQAVNALYPATTGEPLPQPSPRLYSGPDDPRFQRLRRCLEEDWVLLLRERLGVAPERLPVLWDADFLLGGSAGSSDDRYVLCEINVSSVSPYPESANVAIVEAVQALSLKTR
ncbi:MAG: hypothetical protein RL701_4934 [Pseudomonadota bacterium]|jgi:hypothetical protein